MYVYIYICVTGLEIKVKVECELWNGKVIWVAGLEIKFGLWNLKIKFKPWNFHWKCG